MSTVVPDFTKLAAPFLTVVGNLAKIAATPNSDNIIQYSAPSRISPICLVDGTLGALEETPDILRTTLTLISCYYMQAIGQSINVESMTLQRNIDNLRPNRDLTSAVGDFAAASLNEYYGTNHTAESAAKAASGQLLSIATESLSLPVPGVNAPAGVAYALESADNAILMQRPTKEQLDAFEKQARKEMETKANSAGKLDTGSIKSIQDMEAPNLAVGKIFDVTMTMSGQVVTLPVLVSLNTVLSKPDNLVDVFTVGGQFTTMKERYHGWKSGQLRFIEDLIFCQDLIDAHKRTAIRDNTGTYLLNRERDASNKLAAVLTGKASIGTASNVVLFNSKTVTKIEAALGGKLKDFATREKMFKRTYAMLVVVVNTEWNQVTVYHRGIPESTQLSIKEFTKAKSKTGTDVSDVVRLFLSGKAPTL